MSNKVSSKASADAAERDEAPILDRHFFATGALRAGEVTLRPATDTMARRGRPPQGKAAKIQQSLRLSPEVLDHFRGTGKGWQARIDQVLRHVAELERAIALAGALPARTPVARRMQEDVKRFNDLILGRAPIPAEGPASPRCSNVSPGRRPPCSECRRRRRPPVVSRADGCRNGGDGLFTCPRTRQIGPSPPCSPAG
jgi:uncharacterized protein (DUF4415 family)